VSTQRLAQNFEYVAFALRCLPAFGDGDRAPPRHDPLEGLDADKGVAAHLLAAFDGLEQKALALRPRRAQKCGDRRF
jgi:hypothetical protein